MPLDDGLVGISFEFRLCNALASRHRNLMPDLLHLSLAACMFLGAALYTSVGHAGASAYIAFMALFSVPPSVMRPTALTLNILVASFASYRYARAGYFRWRVVWPFLLGSLPFAFIGGGVELPGEYYRAIVGIVLICPASGCSGRHTFMPP
jgi:uncharacterized membrane protein YfcA